MFVSRKSGGNAGATIREPGESRKRDAKPFAHVGLRKFLRTPDRRYAFAQLVRGTPIQAMPHFASLNRIWFPNGSMTVSSRAFQSRSSIPGRWYLYFFAATAGTAGVDATHAHVGNRTRRSVTVMLGEMQGQSCARDLHIERRIGLKAMLPVHAEAEEAEIELTRFLFGEDSQDGNGSFELGHYVFIGPRSPDKLRVSAVPIRGPAEYSFIRNS